jgi:hypothetical protein
MKILLFNNLMEFQFLINKTIKNHLQIRKHLNNNKSLIINL